MTANMTPDTSVSACAPVHAPAAGSDLPSSVIDDADDGTTPVRVSSLHVYPVKSCAGLDLAQAPLSTTGLAGDRQWMLVDAHGRFVTQRTHPQMALLRPTVHVGGGWQMQAPSGVEWRLPEVATGEVMRVRVWSDEVDGRTAGAEVDRAFSEALGSPVRAVQFAAGQKRLSSARWTGDLQAENAFSDGYPILVVSRAALDELNRRLADRGHPPVTMSRFRPNVVLDGLDPHGEDGLDELVFPTPEGEVRLRLVKPCPRCPIPNIDPLTAEIGHEPGDTLSTYRADPRVDGAITFGMNAVIVEGVGRTLSVGQPGKGTVRF
jgi:uncharacterized protein YcbX